MAARFPKKTKGKTAENEQGHEWERGEKRFRDWKEVVEREIERERKRETLSSQKTPAPATQPPI